MLRRQGAIRPQRFGGDADVAQHVGIDGTQARMNGFAAMSQIAQPEFLRIAADLVRQFVHLGFHGKRDLRRTQSAIRACGNRVRVNRQAVDPHVWETIRPDDAIGRFAADHGAVFRICAGIQVNGGLLGDQLAIAIRGGANVHARIV